MRKMFVTYHTGYVGMDGHELLEFPDYISDEDIAEECYYAAIQHAQSYGVEFCPDGEYCEDDECEYEHEGCTNIEGLAVPYIPEKHDMYL